MKMESTEIRGARTLFLHYVTGRLSIPEQEEMEGRLLADQEFSDMMAVCEQELIDAYATGSCTPDELTQLRPWIEGSATRVQRLDIARSFLRKTKRVPMPLRTGVFVLAFAACVLLAAGIVVIRFPRITKPGTSSNVSRSAPAPVESQPASPVPGKADVILLIAERIRGNQGQIPTFFIHVGSSVNLEILLANDTGSHYSLKIVREGSHPRTMFEKSDLEPHLADGQRYLTATLDPGSIPPGTYNVVLTRAGDTQLIRFAVK